MAMLNAPTPAESFRIAVRDLIRQSAEEDLDPSDSEAIDALASQICYRVSDLLYLLDANGLTLDDISLALRRGPDEDTADFIEQH